MTAPDRTLLVASRIADDDRPIVEEEVAGAGRALYLADLAPEQRADALRQAGAIVALAIGREFRDGELALLQGPKLLQLLSAGADHVPFAKLPESLTLASNVGAYAEPMSEYVIAAILFFMKRLREGHEDLRRGVFDQRTLGRSLNGATIGIVGYGGIGRAVMRRARAFGSRVIGVNRSGRSPEPPDFLGTMDALEDVLRQSDAVVLAIPLKRETRDLIGARELGWMKPDAILVNVARGEIVEETALYEHLVANPQFCAAIESWWVEPIRHGEFRIKHPFLDLPNVIGSPHNSALVPGYQRHALRCAVENAARFLRCEPITGEIDRADFLESAAS